MLNVPVDQVAELLRWQTHIIVHCLTDFLRGGSALIALGDLMRIRTYIEGRFRHLASLHRLLQCLLVALRIETSEHDTRRNDTVPFNFRQTMLRSCEFALERLNLFLLLVHHQ